MSVGERPAQRRAGPPAAAPAALDLAHDGLLGRIVRLNLAVTSVLESVTGAAGLSLGDYLVLGVIRRSPGRRSAPTAICEVLGRTTGGMTLTLDRLAAAGLVTREVDAADRRRIVVRLTAAGLRLATRVNRSLHAWEETLTLPGDPEAVMALLDGMTAAVTSSSPSTSATAPGAAGRKAG